MTSTIDAPASEFRWESDMLPSLLHAIPQLLPPTSEPVNVLREVACASGGVPDLVAVILDPSVIATRSKHGLEPVEDLTEVRVVRALNGGALPLSELGFLTQISVAYLRRNVLPALVEKGWLRPIRGRGSSATVVALHDLGGLAQHVVSVEAKKSAWQRGFNQAMRHAGSADASFLALDVRRSRRAATQMSEMARLGVGLMTVDATSGTVVVLSRPTVQHTQPVMRAVLAERTWALVSSGARSGPAFPVFGRLLETLAL